MSWNTAALRCPWRRMDVTMIVRMARWLSARDTGAILVNCVFVHLNGQVKLCWMVVYQVPKCTHSTCHFQFRTILRLRDCTAIYALIKGKEISFYRYC